MMANTHDEQPEAFQRQTFGFDPWFARKLGSKKDFSLGRNDALYCVNPLIR